MLLYTPSDASAVPQTPPAKHQPSVLKDCILPIGMGGSYFAYFVSRIQPDLLHAIASQCLVVLTTVLVAIALLFSDRLSQQLRSELPINLRFPKAKLRALQIRRIA